MGTASDGVVYPNTSAVQLHPIGLGFGLGRREEKRGEGGCVHNSLYAYHALNCCLGSVYLKQTTTSLTETCEE